jgi:hypothetical protein
MYEFDMRVPQGTVYETTKEENRYSWSRGTQASPVTASFLPLSLNSPFSRISDLFVYFPVTYQQTNGSDPSTGYGQSSPSATQCSRGSVQVRFAPRQIPRILLTTVRFEQNLENIIRYIFPIISSAAFA